MNLTVDISPFIYVMVSKRSELELNFPLDSGRSSTKYCEILV